MLSRDEYMYANILTNMKAGMWREYGFGWLELALHSPSTTSRLCDFEQAYLATQDLNFHQ